MKNKLQTNGAYLRELRREHGDRQEDLAEILHVSRQLLSMWECDKAQANMDALIVISEYYNLPLQTVTRGYFSERPSLVNTTDMAQANSEPTPPENTLSCDPKVFENSRTQGVKTSLRTILRTGGIVFIVVLLMLFTPMDTSIIICIAQILLLFLLIVGKRPASPIWI